MSSNCLSRSAVLIAILCVVAGSFSFKASAQVVSVPVTYYDFHSDGSNPEFEAAQWSEFGETAWRTMAKGMVKTTLDPQGKPIAANPILWFQKNRYMKYWFRDWNDSAKNDYTIPNYIDSCAVPFADGSCENSYDGKTEWQTAQFTYKGPKTVNYDTAFINKVYHDSLQFTHISGSTYSFSSDKFFPIDNYPHHDPVPFDVFTRVTCDDHNYSFAMQMDMSFIYKTGMKISVSGGDDIWVFANNKLRIDLGGMKAYTPIGDSSNLDTWGLTDGQTVSLSLFFTEVHSCNSWLAFTSDIFSTLQKTAVVQPPVRRTVNGAFVKIVTGSGAVIARTCSLRDMPAAISVYDVRGDLLKTLSGNNGRFEWDIHHRVPGGLLVFKSGTTILGQAIVE